MKLFHISQNVNTGYDTYSDAVVCAENEEQARRINPGGFREIGTDDRWYFIYIDGKRRLDKDDSWAEISDVKVEYIGEASEHLKTQSVICASFNAG